MKRRYIVFILFLILRGLPALAQEEDIIRPQKKMTGSMAVLSHSVENGLSQTNQLPAIQGSFFYNFGQQFRMGVWGSNTYFRNNNDHFNFRINADLKITFSSTAFAMISYLDSRYLKSGDHDGNITRVSLNFPGFKINYEKASNWMATQNKSIRYAFVKSFGTALVEGWIWENEIGFASPEMDSMSPFFDFKTSLGKKMYNIYFEGAITATSAPAALDGAGDPFLSLSAKSEF